MAARPQSNPDGRAFSATARSTSQIGRKIPCRSAWERHQAQMVFRGREPRAVREHRAAPTPPPVGFAFRELIQREGYRRWSWVRRLT
jgi:hypothetical protein